MARSDDLKEDRRQYEYCLGRARNTARTLRETISTMKSARSIQNSNYSVNDVRGGTNFLQFLIENEESILSDVESIINSTVDKINDLNWSITDAENAEEIERQEKEKNG